MSGNNNQNNDSAPSAHPLIEAIANAVLAPFLVSLAIGLPSALLYLLQLGIILKQWKTIFRRSSFFKLYAVRTIWSLLGLFGNIFGQQFPRLGLFLPFYLTLSPFVLATFYFFLVHSGLVDNVATAALLLNRLTAIVLPTKYEKLWKLILPWITLLICIIPLPITFHIFWLDEFVRIQADNVTFTLDNPQRGKAGEPNDTENASLFNSITTLVCLGINLGCFLTYRQIKKGVQAMQQNEEQRRIENRLTICTVLTFFGQAFYTAFLILLYLSATQTDRLGIDPELGQLIFLAVYNQCPWVNDFCMIFIPSLMLLWASSAMQSRISRAFLGWKKNRVGNGNINRRVPFDAWSDIVQPQQNG